jgi:branched-subunit amino acid transport protein
MTAAWTVIAVLAAATVAIKASGPLAVGGRELPPRVLEVIALLAPALLTALVVVETFGSDGELSLDARAAGVGAAGATFLVSRSMVVAIGVAALVAAALRGAF